MLRLWPRLHREPGPFVWGGNCVPESMPGVGCAFRNGYEAETASQNQVSEWDTLSGSTLKRKLRPGIRAWNGTRFPFGMGFGKYVPEFGFRMGHAFRTDPQPETASWIRTSDRDPLSGALLRRLFCLQGSPQSPILMRTLTYICLITNRCGIIRANYQLSVMED